MKTNYIMLDLLVYMGLPYIIWTYGRDIIGDYYAMLLSTLPAIVYTIFRFIKDRQFNLVGVFIISSLLLSSILDLLAGSAIQMLWNSVWLSYCFTFIYIISMIIQKPLAIYFAIEFMHLQGYPREDCKDLYFIKGNVKWFQLVTAIFVIRGLVMNSIMVWLIMKHGADAFMHLIVVRKVLGYAFSGLIFAGFLYAGNKAILFTKKNNIEWLKPVQTVESK
ncbi:VC0807 family protein [Psychrobacillus sp. FSL H8-0484]|uniref:VC0807 family protein n=1 Tax=Psychrobacillus sp. FSL H8-0484 TaxID=2921390 RepID=UPI0030F69B03